MKIIGDIKIKAILGSFFKTVERDDADILKVINKRIKLSIWDKISIFYNFYVRKVHQK